MKIRQFLSSRLVWKRILLIALFLASLSLARTNYKNSLELYVSKHQEPTKIHWHYNKNSEVVVDDVMWIFEADRTGDQLQTIYGAQDSTARALCQSTAIVILGLLPAFMTWKKAEN